MPQKIILFPVIKKWLRQMGLFFVLASLQGLAAPPALAAGVHLVIDGQKIEPSPPPELRDGRTLVPLRLVSETLGAEVEWREESRTVLITRQNRQVKLRLDNRLVNLRGGDKSALLTDVPPVLIENRTFVPLRLVATALGVAVRWEAATATVYVDSKAPPAVEASFSIAIASVRPGQVISDTTELKIEGTGPLPEEAAEVRYQLLDPETGRGPVLARGIPPHGVSQFLPDPFYDGPRILTAALYNRQGRFLAGDAVPVVLAAAPRAFLMLTEGQRVEDTLPLAVNLNFLATQVKYELRNQATDEKIMLAPADPYAVTNWTPSPSLNGAWTVQAWVYDRLGQVQSTGVVPVLVAVNRRLALTGVKGGKVVAGPVSLGLAINYPVSLVRYLLRDPATGREEVLAEFKTAASFRWLPSPAQAGRREVLAEVTDAQGAVQRSDPVAVEVRGEPWLYLEGVGPNQVLTGKVQLRSVSNIPLARVEYLLQNPQTGKERLIAVGPANGSHPWTPGPEDAGDWRLRAVGRDPGGNIVSSKPLPIKVYLGQLYGPQPVIEKNKFLELATSLALPSQARTGMSAALQVAQAILETGWGQYTPVDKYTGQMSYNLFGLKGKGPAGSITSTTWEEYNGVTYRVDAAFRAYQNPAAGWEDHKQLLLTASRYEQFRAVMHNGFLGAWALKRAGYATDSQYPVKLISLIRQYELYRLDELAP